MKLIKFSTLALLLSVISCRTVDNSSLNEAVANRLRTIQPLDGKYSLGENSILYLKKSGATGDLFAQLDLDKPQNEKLFEYKYDKYYQRLLGFTEVKGAQSALFVFVSKGKRIAKAELVHLAYDSKKQDKLKNFFPFGNKMKIQDNQYWALNDIDDATGITLNHQNTYLAFWGKNNLSQSFMREIWDLRKLGSHGTPLKITSSSPDFERHYDVGTFFTESKFFPRSNKFVNIAHYSGDRERETSGIRVFDLSTGKILHEFSHGGSVAGDVNENTLVSSSHKGTLVVWDLSTGKEALQIKDDSILSAHCVALSPDERFIAVGGLYSLKIWDLKSGKVKVSLKNLDAKNLKYSPDGKSLVIVRQSGKIEIIDTGAYM